jgi:hypothetical protein
MQNRSELIKRMANFKWQMANGRVALRADGKFQISNGKWQM